MSGNIDHPALSNLSWNADLSSWDTKLELRLGCPIRINITTRIDLAPTDNLDSLLTGGVAMLEWARRAERACRDRIADELLELYNDDRAPAGTGNPVSRDEFINRITPTSLVRDIDGSGFSIGLTTACSRAIRSSYGSTRIT